MTTAQDQQSPELLPCPFCGSPNVTLEHIKSSAYEAFCEFCGASGPCDTEQWRAAKGWNARALPARGVDPMLDTPAGMEPVATVLSSRPGNDTSTIDKAIPAGTKLYTAAHALPAAEPVAGQCRFVGEAAWLGCAAEHVRSVLATPQDWEGYEVRYLYAAAPRPPATPTTEPQAPTTGALQPHEQLTDAEIIHALETRRRQSDFYQSRIGLACTQCTDGKYRADSNGYNAFHRCDKCLHVPMWMVDSTELVAPIK